MKLSLKYRFIIIGAFFYVGAAVMALLISYDNKIYMLLTELLIILSLVAFISLYRSFLKPVETIKECADSIVVKDFNSKINLVGQKELDSIIEVYNKMLSTLREERIKQEEKNLFIEMLMNESPSAMIILDFDNRIYKVNPYARKLLTGSTTKDLIGLNVSDIEGKFGEEFSNLKNGESKVIKVSGINRYKIQRQTFKDRGFNRPFIIVYELTQELISNEKESYGKVIRMMSHEVNNSIGAVNSIISALKDSNDSNIQFTEMAKNAMQVAIERNINLTKFMSRFSDIVKIPQPFIKSVDIQNTIDKVVDLFQFECESRKIQLEIKQSSGNIFINADESQMEQVFINVLKNSIESIENNGKIEVRLSESEVKVIDNGKGITIEDAERLFTPFFTTKPKGQGVGLTLCREILLAHGFQFNLSTTEKGLTEFVVRF